MYNYIATYLFVIHKQYPVKQIIIPNTIIIAMDEMMVGELFEGGSIALKIYHVIIFLMTHTHKLL